MVDRLALLMCRRFRGVAAPVACFWGGWGFLVGVLARLMRGAAFCGKRRPFGEETGSRLVSELMMDGAFLIAPESTKSCGV